MIKFKCSNCFITYGSILLLILKFYEIFEILNFFEIVWNFWKFWNFMKILNFKKKMKFSNLLKKNWTLNFSFFLILWFSNFFENFQILWNFLTLISKKQLYHGGQLYWWRKSEYPENTTDLPQVTDKLYHIMLYGVHLSWAGFALTTLHR